MKLAYSLYSNRESVVPAPDSRLYSRHTTELQPLPISPLCCPALPQDPVQAYAGMHCLAFQIHNEKSFTSFSLVSQSFHDASGWFKGEQRFHKIKVSIQVLVFTNCKGVCCSGGNLAECTSSQLVKVKNRMSKKWK